MDEVKLIVEALDRLTAAQSRIADAGFAIAQALTPHEEDGEGEEHDPPMPGRGMGMG